jgi:hypothetical protein
MYFYQYDDTTNKVISKTLSFMSNNVQIGSEKDIKLENAVILDGELYDTETIDYWKALKVKELNNYIVNMDNGSFAVNGITMDCNETSVIKLSLGLQMYQINNVPDEYTVNVVDYYNNIHQVPLSEFKEIAKSVGNEYSNRYLLKWTNREKLKSNDINIIKSISF